MSNPALIVAVPSPGLTVVAGTNHAGAGPVPTLPLRYVVFPMFEAELVAVGVVHPIASCRSRSIHMRPIELAMSALRASTLPETLVFCIVMTPAPPIARTVIAMSTSITV